MSLISFSGFAKLDSILNQTKMKVFGCLSFMLKYIFVEMMVEETLLAPIACKMVLLLPHLIESGKLFAIDPQLNQMMQDENYSDLMVELLDVLIITSEQQQYQDIFIANKAKILVSLCLNLMKTSETEAELILEDPQEFVNLAIDSCDK